MTESIGNLYPGSGASGAHAAASDGAFSEKLLDLGTSNREMMDIVNRVFTSGEGSAEEQQQVTALLNMRAQQIGSLSNALRVLFDTIAAIVRNIRA
ncbi:MAG: hypothetical protein KDD69_17255 [Bdellovibrionales bacterium]|nr:hypothetical protein [Bdellovibrionales bacterium]